MQISDDRRRAERLLLTPPLSGRIHGRDVSIHELGLLGSRVEHDSEIVGGSSETLTLLWQGEEITVDCTVARCERLLVAGGAQRFVSGLSFKFGENTGKLKQVID